MQVLEYILLLHIFATTIADADESGAHFSHAGFGIALWLLYKLVLMPILTDSLPHVKLGIPFFQVRMERGGVVLDGVGSGGVGKWGGGGGMRGGRVVEYHSRATTTQ